MALNGEAMRVLAYNRVARETAAGSTSEASQRQQIEAWAESNGHTVTAWTSDHASGTGFGVRPPGAAKHFLTPLEYEWDVLAVAELTRLSRSVGDFATIVEWCQRNGKAIVSVAEGLDTSTAFGRAVASIVLVFAEIERGVD
jgi:site-specific DNA recombinase